MKKVTNRIIAILLVLVCLLAYIPRSYAAQIPALPDDLYLTQNVSGTCTLCSAAMMIRSSMYLHGNSSWSKVTENGLRDDAWISGAGLRWSFSHTVGNTTVQVGHQNVSGMTVESLQALLRVHPEGIVLYCGKLPHALFLTGYDGDIFYCADTVKGISGQQIMLKDSWLGIRYGSQAAILKAVTAYWYITDYTENGHSLSCACSTDHAGIYRATSAPIQLRIRAGHGTSYTVLSSIPYGAEVKVLKASGQSDDDWAHVIYNGVQGYSSMEFLEKIGEMGTVNTDVLNIRADAGTSYALVGQATKGNRLQILEVKQVEATRWGRTETGWVCMDYVDLDNEITPPQMGTVTIDLLNIRASAGTQYARVGQVQKGTRLEILEIRQVDNEKWGRIDSGWVLMDYVKLDSEETETPIATGTVTGLLNIRANAGTQYTRVGQLQAGTRLEFFEFRQVGTSQWGRIDSGWVLMDYVKLDSEETETPIATGTVTGLLNIRANAGTQYTRVGQLQAGTRLEFFEFRQVGTSQWGRIDSGWVLMDYVKLDSEETETPIATGTVTIDVLNIRADTGTQYARVGQLRRGTQLEIFEIRQVGDTQWGRINSGWVSLDYVQLDEAEETPQPLYGTVTVNSLRIRSSAGTTADIVGYYNKGDQVEILETTEVNGVTWGRTDKGWISMEYVS